MSCSDEGSETNEVDDTWEEDWGDYDDLQCVSLFTPKKFPSMDECFEHDAKHHEFDLRLFRREHGLSDHAVFKCINFIRSKVAEGMDPLSDLGKRPFVFDDDKYLKPVLPDDMLLCHDFEADDEARGLARDEARCLQDRVQKLEVDNAALLEAVEQLQALACSCPMRLSVPHVLQKTIPDQSTEQEPAVKLERGTLMLYWSYVSYCRAKAMPADLKGEVGGRDGQQLSRMHDIPAGSGADVPRTSIQPAIKNAKDVDKAYFDSYSYFDIHREMLEDKVRTEAYRQALEQNPSLICGSTVLDVGCGTGVLSFFAARGGATRVVGIDASERIVTFATRICKANGLHESTGGPVAVLSGKSEDLQELPIKGEKVDVLVSEWMGYALLFESMLDSVLHCRDQWLKPGGAMLPDVAVIYVAAATEEAANLTFWEDVYGFDFSAIKDDQMSSAIAQPHVTDVGKSALLSEPAKVKEFDLTTMKASDADFHADFELVASRDGDCRTLVLWFDTLFTARCCSDAPCVLSTSPLEKQTHWMQTVFVLRDAIPLSAGQKLCARCSFAKSEKHRSIDISFELEQQGEDGKPGERAVQAYVMEVASDSIPPAPGR